MTRAARRFEKSVQHADGIVDQISGQLVEAFGYMLDHPDRWFNAAELRAATGASRATIYRRFGNLVAAGALAMKRVDDFRCWKLRPSWEGSSLALELQRRRGALGALAVAAQPASPEPSDERTLPRDILGRQG